MFYTIHDPRQNKILLDLPPFDYAQISTHLELINLLHGEILCDTGEKPHFVYFPTDCIISLLNHLENGASTEFAMTGNEGAIGISVFMGGKTSLHQTMVTNSGYAYRISHNQMMKEINRYGSLCHRLLIYTQSLLTQTAQIAVCNRFHTVDQQLCRRLLMSLDRLPSNELKTTQEFIARMMGVRREGITEAVRKLQQAGLIHHRRGYMTVLDRKGLETRVCECYKVIKIESDRLLAA